MIYVKTGFDGLDRIDAIVAQASEFARKNSVGVEWTFNAIRMRVGPRDDPAKVLEDYWRRVAETSRSYE